MRGLLVFGFLALAPALAAAQTGLSAEIGERGLTATEARLAALSEPTDADRFALGGVRFLGAVEAALQLRWQVGLTAQLSGMPFLRLPIPENPAPAKFEAPMIADLFRDVSVRMEAARVPLAAIAETSDMAVEIDLGDLWFDINGSGVRDEGEDMMSVAGPALLGWQWLERDPSLPAPVIRFDAADAAWLSAYTHLLSGFSDTLLAYDPTRAIADVRGAREQISALRGPPRGDLMLGQFEEWVDLAAIALRALGQPPDTVRAAAARDHLLAMIADNRVFWTRVAGETDNDREWVPNDRQQSALGVEVPQGTGAVWQDVLADAEALLTGEKLIPYLWLGEDAGVNLGRMFTEPRPIDVAGWIQGVDALPYLQKGVLVGPDNLWRFEQLVSGDAVLYMVLLN